MKTRLINVLASAAALLSLGCSTEGSDVGTEPTAGNRVVFTLGGSTRASGDNDDHTTLAATAEEKKINELYAVVFGEDGNYYKTFATTYDELSQSASFDVEKDGTYDVWFVANADEDLKASLLTLTDQTSDGAVKAEDMQALIASQAVGKQDGMEAWHPFLMESTDAKRIVSKSGVVANGGVVTMRRLAVRIDLINAATGVEITSVKFVNRVKQSRLGASNDMTFSTPEALYEDKTYDGLSLVGDFEVPTECKETIYSYESVDVSAEGEHLPSLEIHYTMDGLKFTHTVEFFDSTDPTGEKRLALKRNYLYRIVLTKQLDVTFNLIVDDWNVAEAFTIEDLPFEKHDQAALNAALKVNMFTEYNAKEFDLGTKTITSFYDKLTVAFEDCPVKSYVSWEELRDNNALSAEFTGPDGEQYRLPTEGELGLLFPLYTEVENRGTVEKENDGMYHPYWNDNPTTNTFPWHLMTSPFTETFYLKNGADNKPDTSHGGETDSEYTLVGESQMQAGMMTNQVAYPIDPGTDVYNIHPVYALRFKGTSQYAAYCWELCMIDQSPSEWYISVKIKALPADSNLTVDDVVDNVSFWHDGYLEFKFPGSGYYAFDTTPDEDEDNIAMRGVRGLLWSNSLMADGTKARRMGFFFDSAGLNAGSMGTRLPIRFVKVTK